MKQILIVDDDMDMCQLLSRLLAHAGYQVAKAYSGAEALEYLKRNRPNLIISDLRLGDMEGTELLQKVKEDYGFLPFIIITAYDDIKISVNAMKMGACDYVIKPFISDEIMQAVKNAIKDITITPSSTMEEATEQNKKYMFGKTELFQNVINQINLIAPTDYNVIINGEKGTGKKIVAKEIYQKSTRNKKPFIEIRCNDFFSDDNDFNKIIQLFKAANGGTVFLDDITELPFRTQQYLLQMVKEKKLKKNDNKIPHLDVRILTSSNDTLWKAVLAGNLSEDLYRYLNDFTIDLPPIRLCKEDIIPFAYHFLQQAGENLGKKVTGFDAATEAIFKEYAWPGNFREMKNIIMKAVSQTESEIINQSCVSNELWKSSSKSISQYSSYRQPFAGL